jgi:hypothetical protein
MYVSLTPKIVWLEKDGAISYDLQISKKPDFTEIVINETSITDTYYQVKSSLEKNTTYYWRFRAVNNNGHTDWRSKSFTTIR